MMRRPGRRVGEVLVFERGVEQRDVERVPLLEAFEEDAGEAGGAVRDDLEAAERRQVEDFFERIEIVFDGVFVETQMADGLPAFEAEALQVVDIKELGGFAAV